MPWINSERPGWGYLKARFGAMVLLLSLNTASSVGGSISVLITRLISTGHEAHLNNESSPARSIHIMVQPYPFATRLDICILLVPCSSLSKPARWAIRIRKSQHVPHLSYDLSNASKFLEISIYSLWMITAACALFHGLKLAQCSRRHLEYLTRPRGPRGKEIII